VTPEEELVIYRVAQEAMTNIARHADARSARLELRSSDEALVLVVGDDGRGLPGGATASSQGIRGMRERAMLVGATLAIDSGPARGTVVELTIPR
jgi:two-component system sensor histidine kinase UhpB